MLSYSTTGARSSLRVAERKTLVLPIQGALAFTTAYTMGRRKKRSGAEAATTRVALARQSCLRPKGRVAAVPPDPLKALREGKAKAKALAAQASLRRRLVLARIFSHRILTTYWQQITPEGISSLRQPLGELGKLTLDDDAVAAADTMGLAASRLDAVSAGFFISTTYAAMMPNDLRARLGAYYTPPSLAARLLDQCAAAGVDWATASVLDPACGGGAFLAPVAERMVKALSHLEPSEILRHIESRLRGLEIDAFAAWVAQVTLDALLLPISASLGRRPSVCVAVADAVESEPGSVRYDLVIGNPPYGRVTLSPRLRTRYERSLYGHANLYGIFTDIALRWASADGVIAFVTPTSFMAGQYFKNLRALLAKEAPPVSIDFIEERSGVFDDVLQEAVLATYRKGSPLPAVVNFVTPVDETSLRVSAAGPFVLPDVPGEPWLLPRSPAARLLVERLRTMTSRLRDWGYAVSTGPLVWNRHKRQLRRQKTRRSLPLIWAEAVSPHGEFIFRAMQRGHRPYFQLRGNDDWLVTRHSCVLLQRTTAKEQNRRLIAATLPREFVEDHGGVVIENHLNMLYQIREDAIPVTVLAAFLNSKAADDAFRCLNGSVAVSAYELEATPLPPLSNLTEIRRLVEQGAAPAAIEAACQRLYGVWPDVEHGR